MVTWGNTTVFGGGGAALAGGDPSTPSKSPAPSTSGFSFGSTSPASVPPSTGGGLFGALPQQPAPPPTPAVTPGAPTKSPSSGGGGGLFGTSAPPGGVFGAPAPSGGLFGASVPVPAPAPAPPFSSSFVGGGGGGLFGSPAPAPAPTPTGGFGFGLGSGADAAPHQAAYAAHLHVLRRQETARIESAILSLHNAYNPTPADPLNPQPRSTSISSITSHAASASSLPLPSSLCRFHHVFYDPIGPDEAHLRSIHGPTHIPRRPTHVDASTWADAVVRNPDPDQYVPVVVVGADSLASRIASQQEKARVLGMYVSKLVDAVAGVRRGLERSHEAVRAGKNGHDHLRVRLMEAMRKVEVIRCMNLPVQDGEREAVARLQSLAREADAVGRDLGDAQERAEEHGRRLRAAAVAKYAEGGAGITGRGGRRGGGLQLDHRRKAELGKVLAEQEEGLTALARVVKKDLRDVNILKEEMLRAKNAHADPSAVPHRVWYGGGGGHGNVGVGLRR